VLRFILFFVVGSAFGGASGENLQQRHLWVSCTSLEALVGRLPAWYVFFQVKTFLRFFGGAMMAASMSFPS
jgi:hypothetical protein